MLRRLRSFLGHALEKKLVGSAPRTLISEDCWGGEFDRSLGRPYATPLAGAYIPPSDYLDFLENIHRSDAFVLDPLESSLDPPCPRGRTPYATIYFLHHESWPDAHAKFIRRSRRISWPRLCYKIDFGKPGYTQRDVQRWNSLQLEPALALIPPQSSLDLSQVHAGLKLSSWEISGAAMFHRARRDFDFYAWLRTGRLRRSFLIAFLHFLLVDPSTPSRLRARFFRPASRANKMV